MEEIYEMLIPMFVIIIAAFMVYQYTGNKGGFVGGMVMGVIVLYSVGLVGAWAILLCVLGLAGLFFGDRVRGEPA